MLQALGNGAAAIDESSPLYSQLPSGLSSLAKSELADYVTVFLQSRYPLTFRLLAFLNLYAETAPSLSIKTALLSVPSYRLSLTSDSLVAESSFIGSLAYEYFSPDATTSSLRKSSVQMSSSFIPNLIQSIEAEIMHAVLIGFASQGKLALPYHDAYSVSATDYPLLLDCYLKELARLYTAGLGSYIELADLSLLNDSPLLAHWLSLRSASSLQPSFSIDEVTTASLFSYL
ncbi:MAG: hypothetical protein AAGJ80_07605 [Cyanobacteria bacterium J06553_1]